MCERSKKTVLAIFAHPDDELGVAGTLANHSERGDDVYLVFLTKGENASTITGTPDEIKSKRMEHTKKIEQILGVTVRFMDLPDSQVEYNISNGYKVAEIIKEYRPDILISWSKMSRVGSGHPDHRHTASLVFDAISYARYKNGSSQLEPYREHFSYYTYLSLEDKPHSQIVLVDVTEQEGRIREFINVYKEAYGDWPVEDYKFGSLAYYGRKGRVHYAECFDRMFVKGPVGTLLE
ncbi:MAG: PIG-L family deacetylase [Candidatus Heimdallarchaeota archaeon]|nr:PIG-L family deacetylase [Candidatus Heimdallarchaeota archaeon]